MRMPDTSAMRIGIVYWQVGDVWRARVRTVDGVQRALGPTGKRPVIVRAARKVALSLCPADADSLVWEAQLDHEDADTLAARSGTAFVDGVRWHGKRVS